MTNQKQFDFCKASELYYYYKSDKQKDKRDFISELINFCYLVNNPCNRELLLSREYSLKTIRCVLKNLGYSLDKCRFFGNSGMFALVHGKIFMVIVISKNL